jgi:hypothetical protein
MALECFKILYKLSPPCLNDSVVLKNSKYSFSSTVIKAYDLKNEAGVIS